MSGSGASTPEVSVVFATHRPEPGFDWLADSLAAQVGEDAGRVEVVLVDGLDDDARRTAFERAAGGRFPLRVVPAKPTPWNGPYRLTGHEYHGAASARNTGLVCAAAAYVVFVDDCSVLMPSWWGQVVDAARSGAVTAGACHRHRRMLVEAGRLVRSRAEAGDVDPRWRLGADGAAVRVTGGHLAGGSFGAPHALLTELNGFDELCDPVGVEVAQLGRRLEIAGTPILYSREMLTIRSAERRGSDLVRRLDKSLDRGAYESRLAELGATHRVYDGPCTNAAMILDLVFALRDPRSLGNWYELAGLDEEGLIGTGEDVPLDHWFDGQPLAEM